MANKNDSTDFNDLHAQQGLDAVREQLSRAEQDYLQRGQLTDSVDLSPPDYSADVPPVPPDDDSLAPPDGISVESMLRRYALLMPDGKIWDADKRQIIKKMAFKDFIGAEKYKAWMEHSQRRTVDKEVVRKMLPAPQEGERGLMGALMRYVYLNPSNMAWDRKERELIPLNELKFAIADCFNDWIAHPNRVDIKKANLVFDPTQTCNPATHINTFRGFAISPGTTDTKCLHIIAALSRLCNDEPDVLLWLRRWLAYPLQNPGAKMATAVLMHSSVHGSGKSYIFDEVMRSIYGEYGKTVGQAQLEGQYNDWMSRTLYACYEEVLSRGQKYSHTGTLKQMITGRSVRLDKKFASGWEEANHMNCVFLSNEILPLPVEPSDRRFLVIWPEHKMSDHVTRAIDYELKNGGIESFYYWLLKTPMQLEGEDYPFGPHTKPPMTAAKAKLIEHGLPIWEVFFNAWEAGHLRHGGIPVPFCPVRAGDLFKIFDRWCLANKEHGMGRHKFTSFIASKVRRRADVEYLLPGAGKPLQKADFFMPGDKPDNMTQKEWLGQCVHEFDRILAGDLENA